MTKIIQICYMVVLLSLTSCIKETLDECPTQYTVKIQIKDKNYSNVAQFPQELPKAENLPFALYSGNIYYSLNEVGTGKTVRQSDILIPANNVIDYMLSFANLPEGEYELVVWGNITKDIEPGTLHNANSESTDVYIGTVKANIISGSNTSVVEMERAKGKLLVICNNFPASVTRIHQKITPVYATTDAYLNYTETTQVEKDADFATVNELLVAPTPAGTNAKLNLSFDSNEPESKALALTIPEIELSILRNEITAITMDYNQEAGIIEILMFINGNWKMIHRLNID